MAHIFISYSRKNQPYARRIADDLLTRGFDVWIDDRIDFGDDWWSQIVRSIRDCAAFVVLMTPESDQSRWVQREVSIADELDKPIFPILLEGELVNSTNWMLFVRTQYVDIRDGTLPDSEFYDRISAYAPERPALGREITQKYDSHTSKITKPRKSANQTGNLFDVTRVIPPPFEWCKVPAGTVLLEDSSMNAGTVGGKLKVDRFFIAKYPVTNAQYQVFVDAKDGYSDPRWWEYSPEARGWRQMVGHPAQTGFEGNDLPRTRISWFDAVAFCNWLTHRLTGGDNAPTALKSIRITLPTEQQWQHAAQGDDNREYPWGNEFDRSRCNTPDSRNRKPTPVRQYEGWPSPYGVVDMSGNIWEWCITAWGTDSDDITGDVGRAVRGGSWDDLRNFARVTNRNWFSPYDQHDCQGFRLVMIAV